MDSDKDEAYSL